MAPTKLKGEELRNIWAHAQGFGGDGSRTASKIAEQSSWVRTLAGGDPYFALFARGAKLARKAIDRAVAKGQLRVTPAARGCMYLVPRAQADVALALSRSHGQSRMRRDLEKAGAKAATLRKTREAISRALESGPLTTHELRKAMPSAAIASLGAAGKKVGLSSTLPPTLRELEWEGHIERCPVDGALDTELYAWSLRTRKLQDITPAEAHTQLAEIFFAQHGPGTLAHFLDFSALGKRAAKSAIDSAGLGVVATFEDEGEVHELFGRDAGWNTSKCKGVRLLGLQDLYLTVHGGPGALCPGGARDVVVPRWGPSKGGAIRDTKHLHLRSVLVDGKLAGFWEVDAQMQSQTIAWITKVSKADQKRGQVQLEALRSFMRDTLGHAKMYSIDSDAKIDARFELVRKMA